MKWEYEIQPLDVLDSLANHRLLNRLGKQGWELVCIKNYKYSDGVVEWRAYMKRPLKETTLKSIDPKEMDYEDLLHTPQQEKSKIVEFPRQNRKN